MSNFIRDSIEVIRDLKQEIAELKDSVAFEKRNFLLKENAELKAENEQLKKWMEFYGIEVLEDGGTQFKPSSMDKFRKIQNDKEFNELKAENERLVLKDLQNQDWLNESWDKQTAMVSQIEKLRTENEELKQYKKHPQMADVILRTGQKFDELKAENERLRFQIIRITNLFEALPVEKRNTLAESYISEWLRLKAENERLKSELSEINFKWWEALALNDCVEPTPEAVKKYVLELQSLYAKEKANEILAKVEECLTEEFSCEYEFSIVKEIFAKFAQENSDILNKGENEK